MLGFAFIVTATRLRDRPVHVDLSIIGREAPLLMMDLLAGVGGEQVFIKNNGVAQPELVFTALSFEAAPLFELPRFVGTLALVSDLHFVDPGTRRRGEHCLDTFEEA